MLFILILIAIGASIGTSAPLLLVFIGFLPSIATIVFALFLYEESFQARISLWFLPFVLVGLFFVAGTSIPLLRTNLDVGALIFINVIYSLVYLILFFLLIKFVGFTPDKSKPQAKPVSQNKSITEVIASIEDKSKAINFVIGRVYSKYHGGSADLRKKIRIDSEIYNEFSHNFESFSGDDSKILELVVRIRGSILRLKNTEKYMFGSSHSSLKNLLRSPDGSDKIIDVLSKNDKDPVMSYFKGAVEILDELSNNLQNKSSDSQVVLVNSKSEAVTDNKPAFSISKSESDRLSKVSSDETRDSDNSSDASSQDDLKHPFELGKA